MTRWLWPESWYRRFIRWLAESELDALRMLWVDDVCQKQRVAWEAGRAYGEAQGRLYGQRDLVAELESLIESRRDVAVSAEDVEVVKKRMVH